MYKQGVSGKVDGQRATAYTLPVSYSSFFVPVTGFGNAGGWGPIYSALTVHKDNLTSITLGSHEPCIVYVITIGM